MAPIPFSEREKDVINLLLQGKGNKQIAVELGISSRTVEFHLTNIYAKLEVRSRSEAILKLTEPPLRESAGAIPVVSTVVKPGDGVENGSKSILRRMPVKKLYAILGGLSVTILLAAVIIFEQLAQTPAGTPPAPVALTPVTNLFGTSPSVEPATLAPETMRAPMGTDLPAEVVIPPHTVNGYTAKIESYYVDSSHVIFLVRITGGDVLFGDEHYYDRIESPDLYNDQGELINTSGGWGPAVDPEIYHFEFVPQTLFTGDRLKGQFAFKLSNAPDHEDIRARFHFDFDLPIYSEMRFYLKQAVTANELEILLDSVVVTPVFTHAYVCFPPPSYAPWSIGSGTILQLEEQQAPLHNFRLLFGADLGGDRRAGSEPYWAPPTKNGRCVKIGFPIGNSRPTSLTLSIPELAQEDHEVLLSNQLSLDYPGLSPRDAYHTYLAEHGKVYKGPWVFTVQLTP